MYSVGHIKRDNEFSSVIYWGRVTHICVSKLTIIGSDNGLAPDRRQAIIWTNGEILLIGPLGTNFSEILIEILTFSFKNMRLKVSSAKRWPICLGLNVLSEMDISFRHKLFINQKESWSEGLVINIWYISHIKRVQFSNVMLRQQVHSPIEAWWCAYHYSVILGSIASQITSLTIVYWSVYSGADQRKHQSSAFVRGIQRTPVTSPHKGPVTRKMFLFDDVIMCVSDFGYHWCKPFLVPCSVSNNYMSKCWFC